MLNFKILYLLILIPLMVSCENEFTTIEDSTQSTQLVSEIIEVEEIKENDDKDKDDEKVVIDPEKVKVFCEEAVKNGQTKVVTKSLYFPPTGECGFGENGNLEANNGFLQGRIEQKPSQSIYFQDGQILCDMQIDFSPMNGKKLRYDDEILMKWDENVLFASQDFYRNSSLPLNSEGQMIFDWNVMKGNDWDQTSFRSYCLGQNRNSNYFDDNCSIPESDEEQNIKVTLDKLAVQKLAIKKGLFNNENLDKIDIQLVIIGDDNDYDCEHTGLSLDVNLRTVDVN